MKCAECGVTMHPMQNSKQRIRYIETISGETYPWTELGWISETICINCYDKLEEGTHG